MFTRNILQRTLRPLTTPIAARTFTAASARQSAKLNLIGRLGAEPELFTPDNGREMVRYVVATNYGTKENRKTSWFRVAAFVEPGPRRDYLLGLTKGSLVHVEADARINQYEDAEGKKQSQLNLVQQNLELLSRGRPTIEGEGVEESG